MSEKLLQIISALVINFILAWPLSYAVTISDVNHGVTHNSAVITWKTDEDADGRVYYDTNINPGPSKKSNNLVKDHSVELSPLEPNILYYYKIKSCNSENSCQNTDVFSFTTENIPAPDKITGLESTSVTETTISLQWDKSTSGYLEHYIVYRDNEVVGDAITNSFTDTELSASTTYNYQISAVDTAGNTGERSDSVGVNTAEPDLTAPIISEVTLAALTLNSATINWKTDEDSNSSVYYGETSALENVEGLTTYSKTHTVQISGLNEGIVYYYKVEGCDKSGNCGIGEISQFVPGEDVSVPVIDVYLPEYHNKQTIRIIGTTKQYSEVKFYVNADYKGILGKEVTGEEGKIDIEMGGLKEGDNTIKIVVVDSHNLKTEKEFNVIVDTKPPEYTISDIPIVSKEHNMIINGTVTEPCTITFYSQLVSDGIRTLKKVENFHSDYEKLLPNAVTLVWDEVEGDIDYYAIYRNDVGLIGMPSRPPFVDSYANTSTTYKYEIAAVYRDCSVGPKTSIAVTTLDDGSVDVRKPTLLQERCGGITPKGQINTEDKFTYSLGLNAGLNEVIINITDKAGNSVVIKEKTTQDASPPSITYTNLDKLSPSYTKEVIIGGKVSEHAMVHVYIDDEEAKVVETDENGEFSVEISLRRKVTTEAEVRPSSVNVYAESAPIWENNIKIIAIDYVGLESNPVNGMIAYQLCGQGGDWNVEVGEVSPDIIIPRLLLQGVSRIGIPVNLKWQGPGDSEDATITERPRIKLRPLNRGDMEKFDEEFFGNVQEAHSNYYRSSYFLIDLKKPYMQHNTTAIEQEDNLSNHNLGNCIVPGMGCIKLPLIFEIHYNYNDPYGTTLTGTRGEDYDSLSRRREEPGIVYGTQRLCFDVEIAIDRRLPLEKILPKQLLDDVIKVLNDTVTLIDKVLEPINTVKRYVMYGCMGMWVIWLGYKVSEWTSCKAGRLLEGFDPETCDPRTDQSQSEDEQEKSEACASCLKARAKTIKHWETTQWVCDRVMCPAAPTVQKYVRDAKKEKKNVLGILSDTKEKSHCEVQEDEIYFKRKRKDEVDKEYRTVENYELEVRDVAEGQDIPGEPDELYCESEYIKNYDSAAIFMNELKESECFEDREAKGCKGLASIPRLLRGVCDKSVDEGPRLVSAEGKTYLIVDQKDIEEGAESLRAAYEIVRVEKESELEPLGDGWIKVLGNQFTIQGTQLTEEGKENLIKPTGTAIMDENDCYMVDGKYNANAKFDPKREYIEYDDISNEAGRKELGIDLSKNPTWDLGNFKPQMCGKTETQKASQYNIGDELDTHATGMIEGLIVTGAGTAVGETTTWTYKQVDGKWHYDKKYKEEDILTPEETGMSEEINITSVGQAKGVESGDEYWVVYGKWTKEGQEILATVKKDEESVEKGEGECTNIPRAVWEEVCGDEAKDYVVDPTADIISAFQSGCLTAMSAYLEQWKSVLEMTKHCLEQLLYTGEGSSGVCKQFLSIYLCDLIYYAIRCIFEKTGRGYGKPIKQGVFGFVNYLRDGGANIQNSIRGRYGTSTVYRTMFVEKKLIHSACAWAFTGDFDLDMDAMLDANIVAPVKTMCYVNGNRRFAYADPQTGRASFIYNLGVFMVGGGSGGALSTGGGYGITTSTKEVTQPILKPVMYRVELLCSADNSCRSDISEDGRCDCLTYGGEQARRGVQNEILYRVAVGDGTLEQGETLNEEVFLEVPLYPVRFDRARILVSYVDNNGVEHFEEPCAVTYLEGIGTRPPVNCKFDLTQGFLCEFEWGEFVTAYFDRVKIKKEREIPLEDETKREELWDGDIIELKGTIRKEGSTQKMEEEKVYLQYRLYGGRDITGPLYKEVSKRIMDLETDFGGNYAFPGIEINNNGALFDETAGTINPFVGASTSYLVIYPRDTKLVVSVYPQIKKTGVFNPIKIKFKEEDNVWKYEIEDGECEDLGNGIYDNGEPICKVKHEEKIYTFTISGTPEGETLEIYNKLLGPESEDIRLVYLEISLHAANEDNEKERTPLTYDGDPQIRTFDFLVHRMPRELEDGDRRGDDIYWDGKWIAVGEARDDGEIWYNEKWLTEEEYDEEKEKEEEAKGEVEEEFISVGGCPDGCFLKKETAERFLRAVEKAKEQGITIKAASAYRSPEKQKELWEESGEDRDKVCGPDEDGSFDHCPHVTGNAVDISVEGLDTGPKNSYQSHTFTSEQLANHKKILDIMSDQGFVRYGDEGNTKGEWWHFEYKTDRWERAQEKDTDSII